MPNCKVLQGHYKHIVFKILIFNAVRWIYFFNCLIENFKEFINTYFENRETGKLVVIESRILPIINRNKDDSSLQIKKQIIEPSICQYRNFLIEDFKDCKKRQNEKEKLQEKIIIAR